MKGFKHFLRHVDIFSDLGDEGLTLIHGCMKTLKLSAGETLFHQGDPGDRLFIIAGGKVGVSVHLPNGRELKVEELWPGDFFGEMSIFEDAPRSATCYILQDSLLLSLEKDDFLSFISRYPEAGIKVLNRILNTTTLWLKKRSRVLSDIVLWGEEARRRAITDELTGLYNRRFLDDALEKQFSQAQVNRKNLTLVMMDLDRFREINEHFSANVGDRVIVSVCPVMKRHLRERDIIARYGGDEFTFLLPGTGPDEAADIAESIRRDVSILQVLPVQGNGRVKITRVTTSLGVASFPRHAEELSQLKEKADKALYKAKETGRNRTITAF